MTDPEDDKTAEFESSIFTALDALSRFFDCGSPDAEKVDMLIDKLKVVRPESPPPDWCWWRGLQK